MAYCPHCGAQLPEGAEFCPNCGRAVGSAAAGAAGPPAPPPFPARLAIDYPDRPLNRTSTFFRLFAVIPIAVILGLVDGGTSYAYLGSHGATVVSVGGGGILVLPVLLMLLFRQKYPRWWFDWNLELTRFATRVSAYLALLDDRYPSTDDAQSVRLDLDPPDAAQLSRGLPLIKWFLAIPHYVVLFFLGIGAFFVVVFAWFAILFTGRYPRGAFDYVVGVMRWGLRVEAYAFLLVTDRYPPFSLEP
jgi:hypothetical protein